MLSSVGAHALRHEVLSEGEIARRYPQFQASSGDIGVLEHDAGVLFAERCVQALVEVAQRDRLGRGPAVFREAVGALTVGFADGVRGAGGSRGIAAGAGGEDEAEEDAVEHAPR
ncbi:N-methyltryptophan oxidase [compost metagenome]